MFPNARATSSCKIDIWEIRFTHSYTSFSETGLKEKNGLPWLAILRQNITKLAVLSLNMDAGKAVSYFPTLLYH